MSKLSLIIGSVLGCVVIGGAVSAQTYTAFDLTTPQPGNSQFGATLGLSFTVNSPIVVTSLGAFDAAVPNTITPHILNGTIVTTIYNSGTQAAVAGLSSSFTAASPGVLSGGYLYKTVGGLNGVVLPVGNYVVAWTSITNNDQNANGSITPPIFNEGNNLITINKTSFLYNEPVNPVYFGQDKYPINSFGGQLYGPTFKYTANTPEPGAVSLFAGLVVMGGSAMLRRRRLRRKNA